jgi:hypothetical protein
MTFLAHGQTMIAHGMVITAVTPMWVAREDGNVTLVTDKDGGIESTPVESVGDYSVDDHGA